MTDLRDIFRRGFRRFSAEENDRLNVGRVQGKEPYPIVPHCGWCAENKEDPDQPGHFIAEDNIADGDEVIYETDDDIGLTFVMHARCVEIGWAEDDFRTHTDGGGAVH
jgi:hypothetical protein